MKSRKIILITYNKSERNYINLSETKLEYQSYFFTKVLIYVIRPKSGILLYSRYSYMKRINVR